MRKLLLTTVFMVCFGWVSGQDIFGTWRTIDDKTGKEKSIVEIYEKEGKIYGKIIKILNPKRKNPTCDKCKGENHGKPILGLIIIEGLESDGDVYEGGKILNPENGKEYKCRLKLEADVNTLQVRGYLGFLYKTQYWVREK